ncbi:nucleotide sugar dehydrogenase [Gammaproteobacteria bacterium]|nr:nucleotide sugar dehydrogenase [Gammaproteobacteria bacterium]
MKNLENYKIAIIGLGYVGLPLALEFAKKFKVVGLDLSKKRVLDLNNGIDSTKEVDKSDFEESISNISFTYDNSDISKCDIYIVTVPTPVDDSNRPDMTYLKNASSDIAPYLDKDNIVIYESTVYPGATEEICVPILEEISGLELNNDFFVGYSPERINPGDKEHRLPTIKKVISGSNKKSSDIIYNLYSTIITAGVHKASSIKVAEAAKVIENTQRDINIALMNELSLIFDVLDIDTHEVISAASTKWNFLPFKPGLVGGHCIGVDPYYLSYKAEKEGYWPEIVLAGRRLNNKMAEFVAQKVIKQMIIKSINIKNSNILVMGLTFKENCPDIRNSKVFDVIAELESYDTNIHVYDPFVDMDLEEVKNINLIKKPLKNNYDGLIFCVKHDLFLNSKASDVTSYCKSKSVIYDVTGALPVRVIDQRL